MKLQRPVTNDPSAPGLEYITPGSANLSILPQAAIAKGKKKATVVSNTASNHEIVHDSSRNTHTQLDFTRQDKIQGSPLKHSEIGSERQPSDAQEAYKISPGFISGHKQRLFHKRSTSHVQVQPPKETQGGNYNNVIAQDPINDIGGTTSKENSSTARRFFDSLRSKKSMANLSKTTGITTMPNDPDVFFSTPSKDLSGNESNTNAKGTSTGTVLSPFDGSPDSINPVAQPTESVFYSTASEPRAINPVNSLPITNPMWKPFQSLGTASTGIERPKRPKRPVRSTAKGESDLSPPDENTDYHDDSSEANYRSPAGGMGDLSKSPSNSEGDEPEFADDSNAVRQLTKLHLQNVHEVAPTRELLSSNEQAAISMGSATSSDAGTDSGIGDADPAMVESTSGSFGCSTDAARKMLEMSAAIDHLHAAAEAADGNTAGHHGKSPGIATEEQKRNYSAGMVTSPLLSCFGSTLLT